VDNLVTPNKRTVARTIGRLVSFAFYEPGADAYREGSAQIFLYGDRGFMFAIDGPGFWVAVNDHLVELMAYHGLRTLEGYMSPAHTRLALRMIGRMPGFEATAGPVRVIEGHKVRWVTVERKAEAPH
jgi:hypothetical protein